MTPDVAEKNPKNPTREKESGGGFACQRPVGDILIKGTHWGWFANGFICNIPLLKSPKFKMDIQNDGL